MPEISKSEFLQAAIEHAESYGPVALDSLDRTAQSYMILTLSRALFAATTGEQPSKREAAEWVGNKYPQWRELTVKAYDWRARTHEAEARLQNTLPETRSFVLFVLEEIHSMTKRNDA